MNGTGEEKRTSPWVYVAIGCSIPIVLIAILFGATAFFGWRVAKHIREDTPEARALKVKEVLGCREIPEGYYATMTLSVPFIMDLAILSDKPPDFSDPKRQHQPFGKQGFIYVKTIRGRKGRSLRDYVEGKADASEVFDQGMKIQIGDREEIGRGSFPLESATVYYVANRGSIMADQQSMRGLVTLLYFECPGDSRSRMGIWFGSDPGTQADEGKIREFVSGFSPCGH